MCGLAAIVGPNLVQKEKETFWSLLLVTSLRGIDSTGIISVEKSYSRKEEDKPVTRWVKSLGDPFRLRGRPEFLRIQSPLDDYGTKALIGHCRAATRGHLSPENAHPFDVGKIIGVHNGTIRTGLKIPEGETDSEALFELIQKEGIEGLKNIDGAYALIWYDKNTNCVHALRNNERPLYYCEYDSTVFLASEKEFLEFAIGRHGTLALAPIIKNLPEYTLLTVNLQNLTYSTVRNNASNLTLEDKRQVLVRPTPSYSGYGGRFRPGCAYDLYDDDWPDEWASRQPTSLPKAEEASKKDAEGGEKEHEAGNGPIVEGVHGEELNKHTFPCYPIGASVYVTRKRYNEYLKAGCCWCGTEGKETDPVVWGEDARDNPSFGYKQFMCEQCIDGSHEIASTFAGFDVGAALADARRNIGRMVMAN